MKKNKILFFCLLLIIIIIQSCIKPSKDEKEINIINLLKDTFDELNRNKDNPEEQLKFFKDIQTKFQAIVVFNKDSSIYINSMEATPSPENFAYTLNKNQIIVTRPLYVAFQGRNFCYSFDNKIWYIDKSDPIKEIEGIKRDYYFNTKIDGNNLYIDYWMTFSLGRAPKTINIAKKKKEVLYFKKNKIFLTFNDEGKIDNIGDKIIYIPANTLLSWSMSIDGNFIKSDINESKAYISFMRDIFIFIKKKLFSLSFDKINWNVNILSFNIKPDILVKAIEENHIYFDFSINVMYEKGKINFSLIEVLMESIK
jgi:hypothetical protein